MSKLKIAVIGAGSISSAHLNAYAKNPEVEVVAICDLVEERAKSAADKYGASKVFTDYRELLADPEIEAVSICTWNNTHVEISIAALDAGKHVLVEKPMSTDIGKAEELQKAVQRSGKLLQVGFVRRYGGSAKVLKQFIDAGDLGDIYYAKASILRRLGNPGGWFSDRDRSGGGPLMDIGVHIIDLCWYMMGRPKVKSVSGNTYNKLGNRAHIENLSFYRAADYDASKNTVEDLANALIRFENGASLFVDVSFTLHQKNTVSSVNIYGDKGGAEIEPDFVIATEKHNTILNIQPQIDYPGFHFEEGFQNEINHFVNCCLGRAELISPVEDGLEITKILCGIYESSVKGEEIQF
ncbi:Predicted dehydrogenase [Paenibacillus sp. UNCCL117]|uniref:Gfo/Idh/MocA family protein n=1 Tax=unclassified Paenibacillus TaxID=185978 RepID=UPI00087EB9B0|nr:MULTISPECIES: Gfo/Idh/MocA family oxidoreductase [unclassified Paenibacillus]SDD63100.1 Predicted dehydrogenase [Paenibacillus sp. cl123]SFW67733.1 Predicted dehydrogenase [Paenibacillus sp. UNCCL117]